MPRVGMRGRGGWGWVRCLRIVVGWETRSDPVSSNYGRWLLVIYRSKCQNRTYNFYILICEPRMIHTGYIAFINIIHTYTHHAPKFCRRSKVCRCLHE